MKLLHTLRQFAAVLTALLFLSPVVAFGQTLTIANDIQTYATLTDTTVNLSGKSALHITGTGDPIPGCTINLNSDDAWFYLDNIRPDSVSSAFLGRIYVSGVGAVLGTNVRVVQNAYGTIVIPHAPGFQPLEAFSGRNFTGSAQAFGQYTYYNTPASLGAMHQAMSSFKLKRGYMATVASQANGLGAKVYVAQDADIEISALPASLDDAVQFVRVIPWRWVGKKGSCDVSPDTLNATWHYNWDNNKESTLNWEYVPIRQQRWWPGYPTNKQNVTHLLGYNEPDNPVEDAHTSLNNGDVDTAIAVWPELLTMGLRVGSPAVTDGGEAWLYDFIDKADAKGLRVDYVAIHFYRCGYTATSLYNWLKNIHERTGRPIWITEFNNGANWTGCADPTYAQNATVIGDFITMMENTPWIERYAVYSNVEAVRNMVYVEGGLTPAGVVYRDKATNVGYLQELPGGDGPQAYYTFEGDALDATGSGNDGMVAGAPTFAAGMSGQAIHLDGTHDYIPVSSSLGDGAEFTFAGWVKWDGGANWQRVFDFGADNNRYMFLSPKSGSGTLRFAIASNGGSTEQLIDAPALAPGVWTHVAVTLSGGVGRMYVNGAEVASNTAMTLTAAGTKTRTNFIGKSQFASDPLFAGSLDSMLFTGYALTAAQIADQMNHSLPAAPTALASTAGDASVELDWTQSTGAGIVGNKVYRSSGGAGGPYALVATLSPAATSYSDLTVSNEVAYVYAVTAINSGGKESLRSATTTAFPSQTVLSQGCPATASSYEAANPPQNANDGNSLSTRWTANGGTYPQWWRVDLGSSQPINRIVIDWYNGSPRAYQYLLETSDDDVNYTTAVDATGNTVQGATNNVFATATARYVRVTVTGVNPAGGFAGFWECKVYHDTPPLSQGRSVTASSYESGNEPFDANDGSLATRWTASSGTYPQWWRVDLGSSQAVGKVVTDWYNASARSYKYRIETSDNDVNYATVVDATGNAIQGQTIDTFTATARYVRITVTGSTAGWAAFWECKVYPPAAATTAPAAPTGLAASAVSGSQIDLAWTASSGATSYTVKRSATSGGPYATIAAGVTGTSYGDAGLTASTTFHYVVSAVNSVGESPHSAQASATTLAPPPAAPGTPVATSGDAQVSIAWTASAGAASYEVKRAEISGGPYVTIASGVTGTVYTDAGVSNGTTYYYVVTAIGAGGESPASGEVSATPVSSLPAPWATGDIGAVSATGSASHAAGTFTVEGSGADIGGSADEFRYLYQTATGDCDITVRVASVENTNAQAKAGIMIRETTAEGSRHAGVFVAPNGRAYFLRRGSTGGTTSSTSKTGVAAPQWLRITRTGNTFRAYYSANGTAWTQIGSNQTITMAASVAIGIGVSSRADGTLCTGVFDNVTATP